MVSFEKIPDLVGFLVLTEDGAVLESGGELKNDERSANVVTSMINLTETVDPKTFDKSDCQRISVIFEQHSYTICLSNKKVYVVKRLNSQLHRSGSATYSTPAVAFQSSNQSVAAATASGGGSETDEPSTSNVELA